MNHLLTFLPDLGGGGAQRTVVNIVNHLDRRRFLPVLVAGSASGPYRGLIREDVRVIDLGRRHVRACLFSLAREIRFYRPSILFAAYPDANVAVALANLISGARIPMIMRESNHRTAQGLRWGVVKGRLVRWSFGKADRVVALSRGVAEDVIGRYGLPPEKVQTIYNPVDIGLIRTLSMQEDGRAEARIKREQGFAEVVAVGRLVPQKGFDLLIRAIAALDEKNVRLTILGDGPQRETLLALAGKEGLEGRVQLPGFQENPYRWMKEADLFVLSSRWEGFGHVIVEAMVCGVPVLATRCLSGPEEIISDGVDGMLCAPENEKDLTAKMQYLLSRPEVRKRISSAARESANRFEIGLIVRQYQDLFEQTAGSFLEKASGGSRVFGERTRSAGDFVQKESQAPRETVSHRNP